ncbi:hypothetical protein [Methanobrevibacter sp.]|uniref:hypothetical protein n=1 Tax=Methanobrevibacter sp. TaxID=66852 RepID=UPI003867D4E9
MNINNLIWIGLLHVKCFPNNVYLGNVSGAYVTVLGYAKSCDEFIEKVKIVIENFDFIFVSIKAVEQYSKRIKKYELDECIIQLAKEVKKIKD